MELRCQFWNQLTGHNETWNMKLRHPESLFGRIDGMRVIAGCPNGNCSKVIDVGAGEVLVLGPTCTDVPTPDDESGVRVSAAMILEAADALRANR